MSVLEVAALDRSPSLRDVAPSAVMWSTNASIHEKLSLGHVPSSMSKSVPAAADVGAARPSISSRTSGPHELERLTRKREPFSADSERTLNHSFIGCPRLASKRSPAPVATSASTLAFGSLTTNSSLDATIAKILS